MKKQTIPGQEALGDCVGTDVADGHEIVDALPRWKWKSSKIARSLTNFRRRFVTMTA
jgi:hypothetical protein